jgi:hypothetical protein
MDNKITTDERKLDSCAVLCDALEVAFDNSNSPESKKLISDQINVARVAYEEAFEACVNNVAGYFGGNRKLAVSYVNIARQLRIEDPEGFKARVKAFNGN